MLFRHGELYLTTTARTLLLEYYLPTFVNIDYTPTHPAWLTGEAEFTGAAPKITQA